MRFHRRNPIVKALLFIILPAAASSCTLLAPVKDEPSVAVIGKLPSEIPQRGPRQATLLVLPPVSDPVYDTARMVYTTRPYHVRYFSRHVWVAPPAQMLLPLLARTFEGTHCFAAVLTPPDQGPYGYVLQSRIREFTQDFSSDPPIFRLAFHVQLYDGVSNRFIAAREFSLTEPMKEKTPRAGVLAANDAAARALLEVAGFVLDHIK